LLCVNNYSQEYIDECITRVDSKVSAYKKLLKTARNKFGTEESSLNSAVQSFEPMFFNNMVLVLDAIFVHRARALEKKDGNPLNEVRVICNSLIHNNSIMDTDNTIKLNHGKSVLNYKPGG
jgi:hypothetical protein